MQNLLFTCNAVLPIILLIILGYFLKRIKLFPDNFWKMANKLCFRVCLPCLLFYNVYNVSSVKGILEYWKIVLYVAVSILIVFGLGLILVMVSIKNPKQKGVVLQCIFRSNFAIIGISLVELLANGNQDAVAIAAIISAISIPLFNILAVISLSIFIKDGDNKVSVKSILKKIVTNPLIIGVVTGIVFLCIRALIPTHEVVTTSQVLLEDGTYATAVSTSVTPVFTIKNNIPFLYKTVENCSKVASPLALIALGGDFTFSAVSRLKGQIILSATIRLIIVPVICLTVIYFMNKNSIFGNNKDIYPALIALYGTPVAVSSAPMSAEMDNDEELAGQLVVWTSLFSAVSLFLIILVCSNLGIFL